MNPVNPVTQALKGTNVFLIGMMGCGKTTIAQQLADRLAYHCLDTDALIENATGQAIVEIFAQSGEPVFRELETRVLGELAAYTRKVISTGGGIVLAKENWSYLRYGVVVWLDVPIAVLHERLQADTTRPILQGEVSLLNKLEDLERSRRELYAQADLRLEIGSIETPEEITDRVVSAIVQACEHKAQLDAQTIVLNASTPFQVEK